MTHTNQTSVVAGRSPAESVASLDTPVVAGTEYRVQLPAIDSAQAAGARALVARVRFLDSAGSEIDGAYKGCFASERFGQFIYLSTTVDSAPDRWSEQRMLAPADAVSLRVDVYAWKASPELSIVGPLRVAPVQVQSRDDALFERQYELNGGLEHHLFMALSDPQHSDRAAVLQIRYMDEAGFELPGPYDGCSDSERFGQYVYVGTPKPGASEVRIAVQPPDAAVRLAVKAYRWKGSRALKLAREPRLQCGIPLGTQATRNWRKVEAEGLVQDVALPAEASGQSVLIEGLYFVRHPRADASALRMVCEFLDGDDRPLLGRPGEDAGILADPAHALGRTVEAQPFKCLAWCPPGAVSARLRFYPEDGAANPLVSQNVTVAPLGTIGGADRLTNRLAASGSLRMKAEVFPEWRLRISFEGLVSFEPRLEDIELGISFMDANERAIALTGIDTKVNAGTLRRVGDTLYLKLEPAASDVSAIAWLRGVLQMLPPVNANKVVITLTNTSDSEIPFACGVEPCDALAESRLEPDSAYSAMRVEPHSREAAQTMVDLLLEKHPDHTSVLAGSLDVYRRLGEATRLEIIASRALTSPKSSGKLRHKARHILASLQEQDPHWRIDVPGAWQGQPERQREGQALRVAHLFKTTVPYENTGGAIRCLNIVKFQKQIGMSPLVVSPLGYPGRNITGEPWTIEDVAGVPHYRLSGISRDDLRTIPSTAQLEYTALLTANLLREQGVDLVQASSGYRGYEQALVGSAVARKLDVPFVYEVRSYHEHTWRPMAEWVLQAEFTQRRMAQENRCMCEADAVVTICETMKQGLVERGIDERKIFVVPNSVDLEQFQPEEPDLQLKERLGLRGKAVAGYISNLSEREGQHVLLRAVAKARYSGVDISCLIVGAGSQSERLRELAFNLGISEHVVFTGEVPHDEIAKYYALIDIFVVPRVPDFASDFVTPMKPFEALAMSRAVVISDRPALLEVVEPGVRGLCFRTGDVEQLAGLLQTLSESPSTREQYGRAGRAWIEQDRSWLKTIRIYEEVYRAAQATHRRS